jgi:hypothetical protein
VPSGGKKGVLSRSSHTSISAGKWGKENGFSLPHIFSFYKINGNDLERMPKMKQKCENCSYFEPKGLMPGSTNWGLCIKFTKKVIGSNKESPFFRWADDTCSNFKAREELSDLRGQRR